MRRLLLTVATLALGVVAGWASARIMIERAAVPPGADAAGWREVRAEPDSLSELYQTSYYLARGELPPPQHVRHFVRSRDDDGNTLRADCATRVEGRAPAARWWQLGASTREGTRAMSAGSIITEANGTYAATLWNTAIAGNWLELSGNGDYVLRLIVHDAAGEEDSIITLPSVRRLWC